jgi:hypothetical protein
MRFWIEVACSSVEEVADVIARVLESEGCTVNVRWEQSSHFPQEYVRVDGVVVIDKPYGKYKIMAYFTVKKTLRKPDRCEVKAGYLVKVLEDRLNNPDSLAVAAAIKGMAEGLVNVVMDKVFYSFA